MAKIQPKSTMVGKISELQVTRIAKTHNLASTVWMENIGITSSYNG